VTAVPSATAGAAPPAGGRGPVPAGERGATRVADRVVAKIAAQAAWEALREAPETHLVPAEHAAPHASVSVRGDPGRGSGRGEARVRITVELGYPADIGARCRAVRRAVMERVGALAGMEVPDVAVSIERLHSAPSPDAAQGRVR
jgi:uncharacterized alkaline shock family protein YloU